MTLRSVLTLDLIQTLALAGVVLFLGYGLRRLIPVLARYNIPAPVVGGLVISLGMWAVRAYDPKLVTFDTTLQTPLMIAFFTSIGFGASFTLLKVGGPMVVWFFVASTVVAVGQNLLGAAAASMLGQSPLMGVLAGSVTLTGGPATGLAFAPLFEQHGVENAATLAIVAAMVGIVSGGLIGGPIGTWLITRHRIALPTGREPVRAPATAANIAEQQLNGPPGATPPGEDVEAYSLLKALVFILVAMWIGGWISRGFSALGVTLPAYIGSMLAAAAMRNLDDVTRWFRLSQSIIDDLGTIALSLFLVMALMTLRLWELASLAVPLAIMLFLQVALVGVICLWPIFRMMGRDYDAAVISSGFAGFMLGTTANSMANMGALVERYGPSPKAFLVVPIVGAFLIDFTNALIITAFLNVLS